MLMASSIDLDTISYALEIASINGFAGTFDELGGGEVNDTYKIQLTDKPIILRVAKDEGQTTLAFEARALQLLKSEHVPQLIFFDDKHFLNNRYWILETYLPGKTTKRLNQKQFYNLGYLLADVHKVPGTLAKTDLRQQFLYACRSFGDEKKLLNHPDSRLRRLLIKEFYNFSLKQPEFNHVKPTLTHIDVTPSNILVDGDIVGLIDWEFSKFNDPMVDFSTIYYEDIEYNQGKWRIKIEPEEKTALFKGYQANGGRINETRIRYWIALDKLGAAVFLYWRINESPRVTSETELHQYRLDYNNLLTSLEG